MSSPVVGSSVANPTLSPFTDKKVLDRKILLNKIQELQVLRKAEVNVEDKYGSNQALRRSSRFRMPPLSLSGDDFIVPWKKKEKASVSTPGGVG